MQIFIVQCVLSEKLHLPPRFILKWKRQDVDSVSVTTVFVTVGAQVHGTQVCEADSGGLVMGNRRGTDIPSSASVLSEFGTMCKHHVVKN